MKSSVVAKWSERDLNFESYDWQKHCRGLYQTPTTAKCEFAMHTLKPQQHAIEVTVHG